MADASKQFTIHMSPNSSFPTSAPFSLFIGPSIVERITVSFPPGCANLVNCQIMCGGSAIFPDQANSFFHFDGFNYVIPVTTPHYNGEWAISITNSDSLSHEIQVNIEYRYLQEAPTLSSGQPISV